MKVVWSELAEEDLDTIVEYIAKDKLQAALDMDDLLRDSADGLALFPEKGKPGRVPGTREFVAHKNYILVYLMDSDTIQIVTVLHSAQQWPPRKQEDVTPVQEGVLQADAGDFATEEEVKSAFGEWGVDTD